MFVTQQGAVPRCKDWVPLATQQLRLRSLIQVLAFNINPDKCVETENTKTNSPPRRENQRNDAYSFTLHSTTMSAPFYTSEKLEGDSPKWKEFDVKSWKDTTCGSADAVVIRLWLHNLVDDNSQVIAVWGLHLSGLTYLGRHLGVDTPALKPNSLVFHMTGGYFTDPACIQSEPKIRFVSVNISQGDMLYSYTVNTLLRLRNIQQAIKKQGAAAEMLKQKISMGDFFSTESRERNMLRRILGKTKPKVNHHDLLKIKENIEEHKFRVQVLKDEKGIMTSRLHETRDRIETMSDVNQMTESSIMEHYRMLRREVQAHREWRKGHVDRREGQLHSRAMLNFRTKQLISELHLIYPIEEKMSDKYTICGVHLPDSEDFIGHNEDQISTALGFVTHVIQMVSVFLQVPLRYPVVQLGSRSRIVDQVSEKIPDSEREFPLYSRGKDKLQFNYAVYLLNKNIAQLRWLCGLPTQDLRNTLSNLSSLVKMKSTTTNLDYHSRSLSSSTADLCGSSLSISSPVGSLFSLPVKRNPRTYRVSESDSLVEHDSLQPSRLHATQRHRVSKSVGSAKDFILDIPGPCEANKSDCDNEGAVKSTDALPSMGHSLSYSLDKGLNEYVDKPTMAEVCFGKGPRHHGGSEAPVDDVPPLAQVLKTGESNFRDTWQPEKHDRNTTETHSDDEPEVPLVTVEATPPPHSKSPPDTGPESHPDSCDLEPSSVDIDNTCFAADDLLQSVTTRAEILSNQTSFNRFRLRFKSTLES